MAHDHLPTPCVFLQSRLSPASALHFSVDIPAMDVSLVDGRPQELLLLTLDGLTLDYHAGNSAGTAYTQVRHDALLVQLLLPCLALHEGSQHGTRDVVSSPTSTGMPYAMLLFPEAETAHALVLLCRLLQLLVRLNLAQLDDMMHGSPFPVALVPADKTVLEDSTADPLLFFTSVNQPSRFRGALYTPTIAGRIAALRLQLCETVVWRLYDFTLGLAATASGAAGSNTVSNIAPSGNGGGGNGAAPAGTGVGFGSSGYKAVSSSRGRLAGGPSSGNLIAAGTAGQSAAAGGTSAAVQGSKAVQQVANADLPLQVRLGGMQAAQALCSRVTAVGLWFQLWHPASLQSM